MKISMLYKDGVWGHHSVEGALKFRIFTKNGDTRAQFMAGDKLFQIQDVKVTEYAPGKEMRVTGIECGWGKNWDEAHFQTWIVEGLK